MDDQDNTSQKSSSNDDNSESSESETQNEVTETNDAHSASNDSNSEDDNQSHTSGSGSDYSNEGSESGEGSDSESGTSSSSSSESEEEQEDISYTKPLPPRPPTGAPPPNSHKKSLRKTHLHQPHPPPGPPPKQTVPPSNRPRPPPGAPPKNVQRKSLRKTRQHEPHPPPGAPPSSTQPQPPPPSTLPPQSKQPHPPPGAPPSQSPSGPPPSQTQQPHPPTQTKEPQAPPSTSHNNNTPSTLTQPQQSRPPSTQSPISVGMTVIAMYSFKAKGGTFSSGDRDIDMSAQDVMTVLHDFGNGWIKVDLKGTQGLVPTNYVKPHTGNAINTGGGPVMRAKVVAAPAPKTVQQVTQRPGTPPTFQHHTDKQGLDPPRPSSPYNNVRKQQSLDSIALPSKTHSIVETTHLPLVTSASVDFVKDVQLHETPKGEPQERPPVHRAWSSDDARNYTDPVDTPAPVTRQGLAPTRRPLQSSAPMVMQQESPTPTRKTEAEPSQSTPAPVSRGSFNRVTADTILLPHRLSSPPPVRAPNFAPPAISKPSFLAPQGAKQTMAPSLSRSTPETPAPVLDELYSNVAASEVPPIISQTIMYLDNLALDSPGLFRESASATELKRLKQMFDAKMTVDLTDIRDPNLVAGLLKLYFRELSLPIFPNKLNKQFLDASGIEDTEERIARMKELMREVPEPNFQVLSYLFAHLRRVSAHSSTNKMTPANLGICWGPTLFRTGSQMTSVVQVIIELYQYLFLE